MDSGGSNVIIQMKRNAIATVKQINIHIGSSVGATHLVQGAWRLLLSELETLRSTILKRDGHELLSVHTRTIFIYHILTIVQALF
jgi:hypothetical protein